MVQFAFLGDGISPLLDWPPNWLRNFAHNGTRKLCGFDPHPVYFIKINEDIMNCISCGNQTTNPKFCGRSCAAKFNNKIKPKRISSNKCKSCSLSISHNKTYCMVCDSKRIRYPIETKTLEESIDSIGKTANRYRSIRDSARNKLIASGIPTCCNNCNYNKHVEVCHIKSISSFPLDTKIAEINNISNLIYLCPNCHWEFDNDLLDINLVFATVTQLVE